MRRFAIVMAAVSSLLALPAQLGAAQERGIGIQLLEAPRELADDPRAQLYIVDEVNPGATLTRRVEVSNTGGGEKRVELFAVRAATEDGWTVDPGRGQNELAGWMSIEPATVTLPPGGSAEARVRIEVPGDAQLGEHYAAILAAGPPRESAGGGVAVVNRVGLRTYLYVRGEQPPVEDFEIDTLTGGRDEDGVPFVLVGVTNTGDRAVDVTGELDLTDGPGSLTAGPFPVAVPRTVGPGARGEVRVALDPGLPAGPWLARADLRSGRLERSAEARITFPPEPGTTAAPADAEQVERQRRLLLPVAGSLLLVALMLLLAFWWRRRQQGEREHQATAGAAG